MATPPDDKATSALIGDILHRLTGLMRKEIDLLRSETGEALERAAVALGLLVAATILALGGLNMLSVAAVAALVHAGIAAGWASLIVGGVLALVALLFALKGVSDLKRAGRTPSRAAQRLKQDADTLKEALHD